MRVGRFSIQFEDVIKEFPGVKALKGVSFGIEQGSIHAIMGENGAGKSTLINLLSGVFPATSGRILINGKEVRFASPRDAIEMGITTIHQELNVVFDMDVKYNLFVGNEPVKRRFFVDRATMTDEADLILKQLGMNLDPNDYARNLSVAQCKTLEIGRAVHQNSNILIMDEPTAAISDREVGLIFGFIEELKKKGITIIYISHKIEEIFHICDTVTVLRDGQHVFTKPISELTPDSLIQAMINKSSFTDDYPKRKGVPDTDEILEVKNLSLGTKFQNVSFTVRRGEIFGIAGIVGSGRSELAKTIIGEYKKTSGEVFFNKQSINRTTPWNSIHRGLAYLSEDRKNEGLFLTQSVQFNALISSLEKIKGFLGLNSYTKGKALCDNATERLHVLMTSEEQLVGTLSGGNQQKVVLAKWLCAGQEVLIIDEPTVGIDVGAKYEIRILINELADAGKTIILISSEFDEVCNMCDRMIVMREGRVVKKYESKESIKKEEAFEYAAGSKN